MRKQKEREPINTPDGILVRLKNKLCLALGIDTHKLKILIDRFVLKAFNGITNSKVHFDKINTYNEINKEKMTIKVFFKFLKILEITKVRISITVTTKRNVSVTVYEDINIFSTDQGQEVKEIKNE